MRPTKALALVILAACAVAFAQAPWTQPQVVQMPSASPLYDVQIMIRAGSAYDPPGKEGTANLVARALIEGGFGDPKNPTTKDKLAEITRPWGSAAFPSVLVDKETTTFSMTVPRDAFAQFVSQVLRPMFTQPLWLPDEVSRLKKEALVGIQSRLRFEEQEQLGLMALDNWILSDLRPALAHVGSGTVQGISAITRSDLAKFYGERYRSAATSIATSISDPSAVRMMVDSIPAGGTASRPDGLARMPFTGRHLLIITQPNAIATGIHFGFPINVRRGDPDYWPLFVANTYLGLHRDEFGRLYQDIRQQRGYNYGDYSYIEYLYGRPYFLFPPPTTPRMEQYFSVWIRPVGNQYAHFILKAAVAELDRFVKEGLTPQQVEEAKIKARTLYLNYAENKGRQLGYRLDDAFYRMQNGYLQSMLKAIDAVTPAQVNAAIQKHLQAANLKIIITTNQDFAQKLADDIANNTDVVSKTNEEYHIPEPIPPDKQQMLEQDAAWKQYPLGIPKANITIVKAEQMFETPAIPGVAKAAGAQK